MRRPSLWRMVLSLIGAAVRLIAAHKQEAASLQRLLPVFSQMYAPNSAHKREFFLLFAPIHHIIAV